MPRNFKTPATMNFDPEVLDAMLRFHVAQEQLRDAAATGGTLDTSDLPYPWNGAAYEMVEGVLTVHPNQDVQDALRPYTNYMGSGVIEAIQIKHSTLDVRYFMPRQRVEMQTPPRRAHQLLCLLYPPDRLEDVAGTMEEMFHTVAARHGPAYGRFWYWAQVGGCVGGRLRALAANVFELVGLKRT